MEVTVLTKNPLSLGIIGLMEVIPAISMALFAGHFVDQKRKKGLLFKCIGFQLVCFLHGLLYKRFYHPNYFIFHLLFVFRRIVMRFSVQQYSLFWP
jgi:hypothetical protein